MKKLISAVSAASIALFSTLSYAAPVTVEAVAANVSISMVNVNKATIKELQKLPGIGKKKAIAIFEYREKNGAFNSVHDLKNVPGIGKKAIEKLVEKAEAK